MNQFEPTFSIITIVFNGVSLLEGTVESVLNQTYRNIEYIIVDGGSKDGTVELAQKYAAQFPQIKLISERDKGIYDGMNKGLKLATGDFVLFLNCGDHLFEPSTMEKIAAQTTPQTDVLYGETMLVDDARTHVGTRSEMTVQKLPEKLNWQSMRLGMVVCHQSFLARRTKTPQYIEGNLAADVDWVIKCLQNADIVTNTNCIISEYLMGGASKKQHQQSLKDRFKVLENHFGTVQNVLNHIQITVRAMIFKALNQGKKTY